MDDRPRLGVNDMDNDSTMTPAPFKKIASFLHATWAKGLAQKRPGELFLSMQLKGASSANANVLQAKVRVRLNNLISPMRENSSQSQPAHLLTRC